MFGFMTRYAIWAMALRSPEGDPVGIIDLEESLSDAEKPPEVPVGIYTGEVQDVQTPTSGKGNQYFQVKFVIAPDNLPSDFRDDYPDGATFFFNRVLVPKRGDRRALFNLRKFMEALGLDVNTTQVDPNEWMGRQARLRVTHGSYQGETRAEIRSVEAAEEAAPSRTTAVRGGRTGNARLAPEPEPEEEEETPKRGARQGGQAPRTGSRRGR